MRTPNKAGKRNKKGGAGSPNWQAERIAPSLGMPHFEQLPETAKALAGFWAGMNN